MVITNLRGFIDLVCRDNFLLYHKIVTKILFGTINTESKDK